MRRASYTAFAPGMSDRPPGFPHGMRALALLLLPMAVACSRAQGATSDPPGASSAAHVSGPSAASPSRGLPPLRSDPAIVPLEVPGFASAVISMPLGSTGPKPVVVATHGLWDFPEGLCDDQRWLFHDRAWVVCPRGRPLPDKTFHYDNADALIKEIDADVAALVAKYPGYVDDSEMLYTGFSLGAILGAQIVVREPSRFPRAVLIEGGEDKWTGGLASRFASGGGKRMLFACGLRGRVPTATASAKVLEKAGVETHVFLGKLPDRGEFIHWYNGPIADETLAQLPWLLQGDGRWGIEEPPATDAGP